MYHLPYKHSLKQTREARAPGLVPLKSNNEESLCKTDIRALENRLCALICIVAFIAAVHCVFIFAVGTYAVRYEHSVRLYVHSLTDDNDPGAPLSTVKVGRSINRVHDITHVAHMMATIATNATDLNARDESDDVKSELMRSRAATIENLTETVREAVVNVGGVHATHLMNSASHFIDETASKVDMDAMNAILRTVGDNRTVRDAFDIADRGVRNFENAQRSAMNMIHVISSSIAKDQNTSL